MSTDVVVAVTATPTVAPTATATPVCEGETVQLAANSIGAVSFVWTGPNGFTSTAANPTLNAVDLTDNGAYTVVATSAAGCQSAPATVSVTTIQVLPNQPVISGEAEVCTSDNLVLQATGYEVSGGAYVYAWTNGDGTVVGTSASLTLASTNVNAISPYRLDVTVDGCPAPTAAPYAVDVVSAPTVSASNDGPVCFGESITLTAGNLAGATYAWRVSGTGTILSTDRIFAVSPSATTIYEVLVDANACGVQTATTTATINTAADITATQSYTLKAACSPADLTLGVTVNTAGSGAIVSYAWTGPNGFTSAVASPVITNASASNNGTYSLVTTDANGCTAAASVDVTTIENAQPEPQITSDGPACEDGTITLSIPAYSGSSVAYTWEYDANGFGTVGGSTILANAAGQGSATMTLSPVTAADNAGEYRVTVVIDGCTLVSDPIAVTVFPEPSATATSNVADACDEGRLELSAAAVGGVDSYAWTGPNGFNSVAANPVIDPATVANNGTYTLTVTSVSGCTSVSTVDVTTLLIEQADPEIFTTAICDGDDLELSSPTIGSTFEWIGPDGLVKAITNEAPPAASSLTLTSINPAYDAGNWSVRVTDANGCVATSPTTSATIYAAPTATATNSGDVVIGGDVTLTASATPAGTAIYRWYDGDPATIGTLVSLSQNLTLPTPAVGTYTYFVTVEINGCVSAAASTSFEVFGVPTVNPTPTYTVNPDCSAADLTLTANAAAGTAPYTYSWTGPNGFASTDANPVIVGADATDNGSYTVTITDSNGAMATASTNVNNIPAGPQQPILNVSGPVCEGGAVTITGTSYEGTSVVYTWTTPLGVTDNITGLSTNEIIIDPAVAATHNGDYTLQVVVDGCTLTSPAVTVLVYPPVVVAPTASYTANVDCSAADLTLTSNASVGTPAYTYDWTGPNGFSSTDVNPTLPNATSAANGSYFVTVTDSHGCTTTETVEVSDIVDPITTPVIASSGPACEGQSATLSVPAYTGTSVTYAWTTPAGTTTNITGQNSNVLTINPLDAATHEGNYSLTVTVDGCTQTSAPIAVDVLDQPTVAPSATVGSLCTGDDLTLTANATNATTYAWTGPAGFASSALNPTLSGVNASMNGTYTVTAANVSGCTATNSVTVSNIEDVPATPVVNTNSPVCEDDNIQLSAPTNYTGTTVNYAWTNGNGASIGSNTAIISIPASDALAVGPYTVQVTVDGCDSPVSAPAAVQVDRIPTATASNSGPHCEGETAYLTAGGVDGATYEWRLQGSATLLSTDRVYEINNATTGGIYELTVTRGTCSSPVAVTTLVVTPAPTATPNFGYTPAPDCSASDLSLTSTAVGGTGVYTYAWTGPNGFASTVANPTIPTATPDANGSYQVVVTDANGCSTTETVEVSGVVEPLAQPLITAAGPVTEGGSTTLSIPTYQGSNVTYTWSTPGGTTQNITGLTGNSITINPTEEGVHDGDYTVTVVVDGCTQTSPPFTVILFETPTTTPTFSYTLAADCSAEDLTLTANAADGTPPYTYAWRGPNGFASTDANPVIANAGAGRNGSYTLIVTDAVGSTATETVEVNGIADPVAQPVIF
ncbi:MAG: hypothetical protein AB8F78_07585 [Saprospiraceae bacterium]